MALKQGRKGAKMVTQRLGQRMAIFLACVSFVVGCSTGGGKPIPGGEAVVAEAPVLHVGDEWRYTGGNYSRVLSVDGEQYVVTSNVDPSCGECQYVYDRSGKIMKVQDAKGNAKPVFQIFDFPLRVGKTWSRDVTLTPVGGGAPQSYANEFKVEGYEEITVKAGTFKAFRISWYQVNRGPSGWKGEAAFWWSPDVRNFVKRVAYTPNWFPPGELESYSLK